MRFYSVHMHLGYGLVATKPARSGDLIVYASLELSSLVGKRLATVRGWLSAKESIEEITK